MASFTTVVSDAQPAPAHFVSFTDTSDTVDNFFGHVAPRYDQDEDLPPAYTELPQETVTLSMYLFKFGFIFPMFWLLGSCILLSPLRAPPSTCDDPMWTDKTQKEREDLVHTIRLIEVKWAKRSLLAFTVFLCVVAVVAVSVWAIQRRT